VAYIVPFIIIAAVALGMLFTCEDTPTGKWSDRHLDSIDTPSSTTPFNSVVEDHEKSDRLPSGLATPMSARSVHNVDEKIKESASDSEAQVNDSTGRGQMTIQEEVVVAPTWREALQVTLSLSTVALAINYACSFGAELALDGTLGSFYAANFPRLGQTESGRWAAMFGLLNVVTRPLGGFVSDIIYRHTDSVWAKKLWMNFLSVITGAFLIAIGLTNPKSEATMFGLTAGMAFFLEAGNGANFAIVPHVHPYANGSFIPYLATSHPENTDSRDCRYCVGRGRCFGESRRHHL
jgi:NNP family nitrate/nitrite transporter-like MFS transporter